MAHSSNESQKKIIVKVSQIDNETRLQTFVQAALNMGLMHFLINSSQIAKFKHYSHLILYEFSDYPVHSQFVELKVFNSSSLPSSKDSKQDKAIYVEIDEQGLSVQLETIQKAIKQKIFAVFIHFKDWKVIPLENLIALFQQSQSRAPLLFVDIDSQIEDFTLVSKTLERGADGVIFAPETLQNLKKLVDLTRESFKLSLISGRITKITPIPSGDRVCVDTSSLLNRGEGLLVGNTARGFAFVEAEVYPSEFVAARPFRVNAGDVSEYVLLPTLNENGKMVLSTKYLIEIQSGDRIWIANTQGKGRFVSVSRVKIERRPLLLFEISVHYENSDIIESFSVTCQHAETVRFLDKNLNSRSVSEIRVGDEILVCIGPSATHFGMPIQETIVEK